jgi:hypothetical protein
MIDTSRPPPELIADSVVVCAHTSSLMLRCEIASVPQKEPNAWITGTADHLISGGPAGTEKENAAAVRTHHPSSSRPVSDHSVSFDARGVARECLKEVGRKLGVP